MQIVLDFLTGKVGVEEMKQAWYSDPAIGQWLENLIDLKTEDPREKWGHLPYPHYRMAIYKNYGGSPLAFLDASDKNQHSYPKWVHIGWYFGPIAAIVIAAYPELKVTSYYDEEQAFYLGAQGDYLGGPEVEDLIGSIMDQYPRSLGKTKRIKGAKAALKEVFHIQGQKYPRWVQEPEWPMGANSPMTFVSQKRKGELVTFLFQDADTGEMRTV